MDDVPF